MPPKHGSNKSFIKISTKFFCLFTLTFIQNLETFAQDKTQVTTLEDVLLANSSVYKSIKFFDVKCTILKSEPGEPFKESAKFQWRHSFVNDRLTGIYYIPSSPPMHIDESHTSKGLKSVMYYDPQNPPTLYDKTEASGVLANRTSNFQPFGSPKAQMLFEMIFNAKSYKLIDLKKNAKLQKKPEESDSKCYEIEIFFENMRGIIFLDPNKNYSIVKFSGKYSSMEQPGAFLDVIYEVKNMKEFGDGIFLPLDILYTEKNYNSEVSFTTIVKTTFEIISVNKEIPETMFQVKFPEWLHGFDKTSGRYFVWGIDEPKETFETDHKRQDWIKLKRQESVK